MKSIQITKKSIKDNLIVFGIFTGILLPLRLVFYNFLHDHWLGTFGVTSIVVFSLFYMSSKGKLGYVGNIIIEKIQNRAKGKLGMALIIQSIILMWLSIMIILGSNYADPTLIQIIKDDLKQHNITDIETSFHGTEIELDPIVILTAIYSIFIPTPISLAIYNILNEFSSGVFLAFFTLFLVEETEFLGIMLFFKFKKPLERKA